MDTLYFLLGLFAFAWLALWSARGARPKDQIWWPFDMKSPEDEAAAKGANATGPGGTKVGESRGWRDRVARSETAGARSRTTQHGPQHGA